MQILRNIITKIAGDPNKKIIKEMQPTVEKINALEPHYEKLSDEELKNKTQEFRERLKKGERLDDLLVESFAVVREASKRTLKMRHFDVQLVGGLVLHQNRIAEMKTGEGKTLVATLPAYLNALEGKGVYIVTVNDYLAKRDSEWMGAIYKFLGLEVGLIQAGMDFDEKQKAYQADITYGTNNEFGFDYLRDNLATDLDECCQVKRHYAIIDEVDSILIDEARTPLIISGPIPDSTAKYVKIVRLVRNLKKETHFTLDEKHKNAVLTEDGVNKIEHDLNITNIYSPTNMDIAHMAVQCLKALHLFKRDVDYVIKDGEVQIVDEFTGRILDGRRYSDGLHQAIEAVENLRIKEESQTLASVTYQNYFRLFPKLAGMTGTAVTEEEEFIKIYGLDVVVIPTNEPVIRADKADVIYKCKEEKYKAIVKEIGIRHKKGQPMLVGTISIEASEELSRYLKREGIVHNVLNAKYHEKEAQIIADAGQKHAVTIATNMAGRGTDIVLGEGVTDTGGLYVIGTERHESRRIDNQLRGRSGRQGDPGESKFYVALDDDLMRLFGSERIARIMETLGLPGDTPIEHGLISKSIERAQKKVEQYHFSIRKQILEYDNVIDKQRDTVYTLRRDILSKTDIDNKIHDAIKDIVEGLEHTSNYHYDPKNEDKNKKDFIKGLQEIFPIENIQDLLKDLNPKESPSNKLTERLFKFFLARKNEYQKEIFDEVTKMIVLRVLDAKWMDHLHNMDILREGIGLRAYGHRDPLLEYKMEAFDMFKDLLYHSYEESLKFLTRVEIHEGEHREDLNQQTLPEKPLSYNLTENTKTAVKTKASNKVGRNDPCPCGSGKKHKKCCMK